MLGMGNPLNGCHGTPLLGGYNEERFTGFVDSRLEVAHVVENRSPFRIADLHDQAKAEGRPLVSFEIFPPKGDLTKEAAHKVASELSVLSPEFVSVTFSAGGSGGTGATAEVSQIIQSDYGIASMAHMICENQDEADIDQLASNLEARGICNVLALKGDPIPDAKPSPFRYSKDLISYLKDRGFCVGAAAYPEGHIACDSDELNVQYLKQKQDAGADFLVTQLFFDNARFYEFRERADAAGITIPISCGIMPILSKNQVTRMVFTCAASLPSPIIKLLARYEHDEEALQQAGIEYASEQLIDLAKHGVDGLHIYTMNRPSIAHSCLAALKRAQVL